MKKILFIGILLTMLVSGLGLLYNYSRTATSSKTIKIGFMAPLSGDASSYGYSMLKGIQLAKKELGMDHVEIINEDSQCDKEKAVQAFPKLINKGVVAIIGETCSGATLAVLPQVDAAQIALISPSATSPLLSGKSKYFFRTVPSDVLQAEFGAKLVYKKGYRKLAVVYSNEEYGITFFEALKKSFEGLGGSVVANIPVERSATNLTKQLAKLKTSKTEAVYMVSNSPANASAIIKGVFEQGLTKLGMFGSEGLQSKDILENTREASEGMILTTVSGGSKYFRNAHQVEYGVEAGPYAAQSYDAFKALAVVIGKGAQTKQAILEQLPNVVFEGMTGNIKFDKLGDVGGNYDAVVVRDRQFVLEP